MSRQTTIFEPDDFELKHIIYNMEDSMLGVDIKILLKKLVDEWNKEQEQR